MLYFIVNQKSRSGQGEAVWKEIQAELKARGIKYKYWITAHEGHATRIADEICSEEDDDICLVVVGGDGTANEVINGMHDFERVRFGTIPTGSGNDLARGLMIKGEPIEQLNRILKAVEEKRAWNMDLGEVVWDSGKQSRKFAISAGAGLDALVCKKALKSKIKDFLNKIHLGSLTYIVLTIISLFTMETADASVKADSDRRENKNYIFLAAMNFSCEGGGVPMAPRAEAYDGKLSVCSAHDIPKWRAFFCLPFLAAGHHTWIKGFDLTDAGSVKVSFSKPMTVHADGEYCGELKHVTFKCLPGLLRVLR